MCIPLFLKRNFLRNFSQNLYINILSVLSKDNTNCIIFLLSKHVYTILKIVNVDGYALNIKEENPRKQCFPLSLSTTPISKCCVSCLIKVLTKYASVRVIWFSLRAVFVYSIKNKIKFPEVIPIYNIIDRDYFAKWVTFFYKSLFTGCVFFFLPSTKACSKSVVLCNFSSITRV